MACKGLTSTFRSFLGEFEVEDLYVKTAAKGRETAADTLQAMLVSVGETLHKHILNELVC